MPEYLDDPSVLTKERLKSELLAHNVQLPVGNPPKDALVQLYLQNLTAQNPPRHPAATLDAFSSDEDLPPPVVTGRSRSSARKATRKTDKLPPDELDVTMLTDGELRDRLIRGGVDVGPVVASTRKLYERKLQKLLENGPTMVPHLVLTDLQVNHNGNSESDRYSDQEDEVMQEPEPDVEPEPEPEPEPVAVVVRTVRSRGKTPVTSRTRSGQHHTVEQMAASEEEEEEEEEVLKELFLNDLNSPAGITATCRRPIRGAASRPVTPGDLWNHDERLLSPPSSKLSSYGYAGRHAAVSSPTSFGVSSRPRAAAAPPATATRAAPPGSLWKKLILLAVAAGFLFLVYHAMEGDAQRPFQGAQQLEGGSSV